MSKMNIKFNDRNIECEIEKGKRKNLYIVIKENGNVEVRAPKRMNDLKIQEFVNSKAKWIYKKVIENENIQIQKNNLKNSDKFLVLGKIYKFKIDFKNVRSINFDIFENEIFIVVPKKYEKEDFFVVADMCYNKILNKIAKTEIVNSMEKIIGMIGLKPKELKIRNFKRAWGNCSSKKIISINKNVCKFSRNAIDYVCLHEVCHLKYMNHSKDFWKMVEYYMPNYKEVEKELK